MIKYKQQVWVSLSWYSLFFRLAGAVPSPSLFIYHIIIFLKVKNNLYKCVKYTRIRRFCAKLAHKAAVYIPDDTARNYRSIRFMSIFSAMPSRNKLNQRNLPNLFQVYSARARGLNPLTQMNILRAPSAFDVPSNTSSSMLPIPMPRQFFLTPSSARWRCAEHPVIRTASARPLRRAEASAVSTVRVPMHQSERRAAQIHPARSTAPTEYCPA